MLGQRYQLGHRGRSCPNSLTGPADFILLDATGFHNINIDFCGCISPPAPSRFTQLLRVGWFPASLELPRTAFTFGVLNLFHKLTLQGKTTVYDYYHTLMNITDAMHLEKMRVSNLPLTFRELFILPYYE